MNILLGLNTFDVGGAENFVFRLAKALSESGHKVYLFALYDWNIENAKKRIENILGKEYSKVKIIVRWNPGEIRSFFLWKLNRLFLCFGKKDYRENIINDTQIKRLNTFLKKEKIDIINTHLFEVDEFFSLNFNLPHVISMHGAYEDYLFKQQGSKSGVIDKDFLLKAERVLLKSKHVVCCADKNLEILRYFDSNEIITEKIYHGISEFECKKENVIKEKDDFIFGMIARGIEEKGWEIAIKSFLELNNRVKNKIKMMLIYTHSDYMNNLKKKYEKILNIDFLGYLENPQNKIPLIDVMILPTYYIGESLPVTLIEALCCNVPVISTNVGEIPKMIVHNEKEAGRIINLDNDTQKPVVEDLAKAMEQYLLNSELYETHKRNTFFVKEKFSMDICMRKYIDFYNKTLLNAKA